MPGGFDRFFESDKFDVFAYAGICFAFGAFTGGLRLLVFPHPLIRPSRLHGISLLVSPILSGAVMASLGFILRRRGKRVIAIETFWYGFAFAFGMALVRLLFVA